MKKLTPVELQKVQQKLVKLFALSASPNEAEAALAMSKCREIMEKHGISSVDVDPIRRTVDTDSRFVASHGERVRIPKWMGILSSKLCDIFNCSGVSRTLSGRWVGVTFVGGASDVAIMSDLYIRLKRIIGSMGRQYIEEYKGVIPLTPKSKEEYCVGVVLTVVDRIQMAYTTTGTDLVVLKTEYVKKHVSHLFGDGLATAKFNIGTSENTDYQSRCKGIVDGQKVSIARSLKNS